MTELIKNQSIWIIVLVTFFASYFLIFAVKKLVKHVNAYDIPNERKVHKKPMARMGGLAIFGSFLLGYVLFGQISVEMISILIGAFLIIFIGAFDDIKPIGARYKFYIQLIAASLVVFYGNIYFDEISLLGLHLVFPTIVNQLISVFFILAITNAINLIDGLDGLAAGISSIYFITIGTIAFILNQTGGLDITLCFIMLGATLGFLVHNFPPAKIFMGDSGSLFLGFIISVISLLGFKATTITTLVVPLLILAIPILDTLLAIFRRIINKKGIATADKEHFHHQLLKLKFSGRSSILIIYLINIMFASVSVFYILGGSEIAIIIYIILMILLLFLVLRTNILFNHDKKKDSK